MTNSISSSKPIVNSEKNIPIDEKPQNNISDLAKKTIPNDQNLELKSDKKITPIPLLSSSSSGTNAKGKEIIQPHLKESSAFRDGREECVKFVLRSYQDFDYYMASLEEMGFTLNTEGGFVVDPKGEVTLVSEHKIFFEAAKKKFDSFLKMKGFQYNPVSAQLTCEAKNLTVQQTSILIHEFLTYKDEQSNIQRKQNEAVSCGITIIQVSDAAAETRRMLSSKEGRVKLILKALIQFDYYLSYLLADKWTIDKRCEFVEDPEGQLHSIASQEYLFKDCSKKFHLFLDSKGLNYDPASGLLAAGYNVLTVEETESQIKEFHASEAEKTAPKKEPYIDKEKEPQSDLIFIEISRGHEVLTFEQRAAINECSVKLKWDKVIDIELKAEVLLLKSILKSFLEFEFHLKFLRESDGRLNNNLGLVIKVNGKYGSNDLQKSIFEDKKKKFQSFLKMKGVQFNPASLQLIRGDKVLTLDQSFDLINEFCANVNRSIQSKPEEEISVKTKSKKYKDLNKENISLQSDIKECSVKPKEKESIELDENGVRLKTILKAFTDFNFYLQGLSEKGCKVNIDFGFAIDINGQFSTIDDLKSVFEEKNASLDSFFKRKGVQFNSVSCELARGSKVLTFDQSFDLLNEFAKDALESKRQEAVITPTLKSLMTWVEYLKELKANRWEVSDEGQFLQGPNDEFFSFEEMRETVFLPRQRKFLQYLKENGCIYDKSCGFIYIENLVVDLGAIKSLIREFISKEKDKSVKSSTSNKSVLESKIDYQLYPKFEEVKKALIGRLDHNEFLGSFEAIEWTINEEFDTLLSPQGKSYILNEVSNKWRVRKAILLASLGNNPANLDQYYESKKDEILTSINMYASDKFSMKYDQEMNLFTDGETAMNVDEMVMHITLAKLGLT